MPGILKGNPLKPVISDFYRLYFPCNAGVCLSQSDTLVLKDSNQLLAVEQLHSLA